MRATSVEQKVWTRKKIRSGSWDWLDNSRSNFFCCFCFLEGKTTTTSKLWRWFIKRYKYNLLLKSDCILLLYFLTYYVLVVSILHRQKQPRTANTKQLCMIMIARSRYFYQSKNIYLLYVQYCSSSKKINSDCLFLNKSVAVGVVGKTGNRLNQWCRARTSCQNEYLIRLFKT